MPTEQLTRMLTTARESYREMVLAMCEGEEFSDTHLREATLAVGFSMADLERHLSHAKARRYCAVDRRAEAQALAERHREADATGGCPPAGVPGSRCWNWSVRK